jgi:hypothetical protein
VPLQFSREIILLSERWDIQNRAILTYATGNMWNPTFCTTAHLSILNNANKRESYSTYENLSNDGQNRGPPELFMRPAKNKWYVTRKEMQLNSHFQCCSIQMSIPYKITGSSSNDALQWLFCCLLVRGKRPRRLPRKTAASEPEQAKIKLFCSELLSTWERTILGCVRVVSTGACRRRILQKIMSVLPAEGTF